jgi:hypothetical protein
MTDQTPSAPACGGRPYTAPTLRELGSVEAVTAGDRSGSLDQLVGSSGGFLEDATS